MSALYGLEYALFFGVPDGKLELIEGKSRWAFPFLSRNEAESHFHHWLETFRRWKQVETATPIRKSSDRWRVDVAGIDIELFPRPIEMRLPIAGKAFRAFYSTFNRRDYWPSQPVGWETGWDSAWDDGDIRMRLWSLFEDICDRHGGQHSNRVDIALGDWAGVGPDAYYYRPERDNILIEGEYFGAAPDLIAEVLSASSRWLDHGPRLDIYRRAGVPCVWLLEPAQDTLEIYELHARYELIARYSSSDTFASPLFPAVEVRVADLFKTQSKRRPRVKDDTPAEPIGEWLLPPEMEIGLEYFFHLGHPEHRWEFWDKKARSVLAFGSPAEATARFAHFLTEACRWESFARPKITQLDGDVELTEVGRFQLTRRGRLVFLDIAVDGRRHREILRWADRKAWDWGDEKM